MTRRFAMPRGLYRGDAHGGAVVIRLAMPKRKQKRSRAGLLRDFYSTTRRVLYVFSY